MAVFDNLNYTSAEGLAVSKIANYYERQLLETVKNEHVHGRDLQKRTLPANNGTRVQFRKMTPFEPATEPLKEGVTPDGQKLAMTAITATIKPYGRHVETTDEMRWALLDNIHRETSKLLSEQALDTIDVVTRDALHSGTNVQYAGGKASRAALTASDKLTYSDIKKVVRTLKKNGARRFPDGCYHAIVSPDSVFDLTSDAMWVDVAKYQDKEKVEKYELGRAYGVKFFESRLAKVFESEDYLYDAVANLATTAYDTTNKILTIAASSISSGLNAQDLAHFVRRMSGKLISVADVGTSTTTYIPALIDRVDVDGANVRLALRWIGASYTWASGDKIAPVQGNSSLDVHSTIVYGQDFAGCVELEGNGKNVEVIMNPPGSSGAADPLNQRGTIAWKVKGFCATILQDAFGVRIEHAVSA